MQMCISWPAVAPCRIAPGGGITKLHHPACFPAYNESNALQNRNTQGATFPAVDPHAPGKELSEEAAYLEMPVLIVTALWRDEPMSWTIAYELRLLGRAT